MEINNSNENQVNTYDPASFTVPSKKKMESWQKGLIIFGIILVVIVLLAVGCNAILGTGNTEETYQYSGDYIGELHIEGTISETTSESLLSSTGYDHQFLMDRVDAMMEDGNNKGIILFVDTPGGSVYASDEFYLKLMEYKEVTGRPVYAYMGATAASGGYYISAAADKIIANRNCWTGSIGVTIGTVYDFSGLLEQMGVSTVTITSGDNKAMGSSVEPLTAEQQAIYQGLVDEAYEQFVGIVAEGRNMTVDQVKVLADGRVYSAKQAKENGLIDDIMSFDDALYDMMETYDLQGCTLQDIQPEVDTSWTSLLGKIFGGGTTASTTSGVSAETELTGDTTYDQLKILLGENNKFTITYMANIDK